VPHLHILKGQGLLANVALHQVFGCEELKDLGQVVDAGALPVDGPALAIVPAVVKGSQRLVDGLVGILIWGGSGEGRRMRGVWFAGK
jgi:hypothetical protein